jgi:hypothetical protein
MSRVARAEGVPAIVPPFHAPSQESLRERLAQAGLPELGMEKLRMGKDGPELQQPSTVGWIYWGRTAHLARGKVRLFTAGSAGAQVQAELEVYALRDVGAYENILEYLNTRSIRRADADSLVARVSAGPIVQASSPTPMFAGLVERLRAAGVEAILEEEKLAFHFQPPAGDVLSLARHIPHPWLRGKQLTEIGICQEYEELETYLRLVETNDRLARLLSSKAPKSVTEDALRRLESRVQDFFAELLTPAHLRFRERQMFSSRSVITPGAGLRLDQVGLAEEVAWALFGPLVARELGDEETVRSRSARAVQTLDTLMARSWVIINRAPTLTPTNLLAFHPVRDPGHVTRLHPLVCNMLDADFDGDQVVTLLPVTEEAQREAGELLSVAGHLTREPGLLQALLPPADALWGLAWLSLTAEGRHEINQLAGDEVAAPLGFVTRATLAEAMAEVLAKEGIHAALARLEQLMERGFEAARTSGASMSPFVGASVERLPEPEGEEYLLWDIYAEGVTEQIASSSNYRDADLGPQLLAVKSSGLGLRHLAWIVGSRGMVRDAEGNNVLIRRGTVEGLTPEEMYATLADAREALAQVMVEWEQLSRGVRDRSTSGGFNVLARARRARYPGLVFASAAATGEVDPLADIDSRLLVGLPVTP